MRCLERKGHYTLSSDNPRVMTQVLFSFFKSYEGIRFDHEFLKKYRLNGFVQAQFTVESEHLMLPSNLHNAITALMKDSSSSETPARRKQIDELIELVQIYRDFFYLHVDVDDSVIGSKFSN